MLLKRIFCFCVWLSIIQTGYAQVNLQTGTATFSLPIFDWKDNYSRLNANLGLSYSSGNGLKVNDVASNIGQGWSMIAGGVITRMQVGEPDDQRAYNGNGSEKDKRKYPNGYLYANASPDLGCPTSLTKYPIYPQMNQVYTQHNEVAEDKQVDYFSFQFNGKVGMFVLSDANGDRGVTLGDSKLNIFFTRDESMANNTYNGTRTVINSFTIQDTDGLLYKFTRHGKTRVLETNYTDKNLTKPLVQPKLEGGKVYYQSGFENTTYMNSWVIGSWYLTEIEDGLTHRKIYFNYENRSVNNIAGQDIIYNQEQNYSTISYKRSITITPEITSIVYPDGHNVMFNYGAARHDLVGQYALSSVGITYNSRYISKYELTTAYFVQNRYAAPNSLFQKKLARLCLRSVRKIGVDLKEDSPPFLFDYYLGSNAADDFVPGPFSHLKDAWGFYNGTNSAGYNNEAISVQAAVGTLTNNQLRGLCFMRNGVSGIHLNPKAGYAKNGLLRQVIYPTGGTLTYEYNQNQYNSGSNVNVGGVNVSKTSSTDGGYSNGCNNPLVTNYQYVMNGAGSASSMWGYETPLNSIVSSVYYAAEHKKYKGPFSGCGIAGCCYYKFVYPGILSQYQAVSLSDFQKFMQAVSPVLGIISLVTTVIDVVNLVFYSSGVMAWVAVVVDIIGGLITLAVTCFSSNKTVNRINTIFYNSNLNGASPLPAQFKRVEVVEGTGTNGRTVHEFTSDADYPLWAMTNPSLSAKQRYAPWAYGLPKVVTVYNANGVKIKETTNTYGWTKTVGSCHPGSPYCFPMLKQPLTLKSCKCLVKKSSSQRNVDWANPASYSGIYTTASNTDMNVDIYDLYTGRVELESTSEKIFKTSDVAQFVETRTEYTYNPTNLAVFSISTTESDGNYKTKYFWHPDTYVIAFGGTTNAEINALYNNNIITEPIAVKVRSGGRDLMEKVTIFTTLPNGNILPWKLLEQRVATPPFNMRNWSPDDPTYWPNYTTAQTFTYNSANNLVGVKDEANRTVTNIYDYADKFVVASVINADATTDNCAYTSFESGTFGGWTVAGSGTAHVSNSGITGARAYNLTSHTFSRTLNTAKPYTLSFWASNSSFSVSAGATQTISAPALHGFTYYEYAIAQGTSSISITGSANIDELRLYPKNARMRTVTYDPLVGKTSDCDENNRVTYYEYDNLGRLRFIKDEARNIVKMNEYNNISRQNGCPSIYYSKLTTEIFTKNNCATGFVGGDVVYTVPSDKYTSTISQEDADAKVDQELLSLGQDYANTNGTCIPLYYNTVQSVTVTSQSCAPGYKGGNVTYTVPANTYSTTESQAAADQMTNDDLNANAQAYANDSANANCLPDTDPDWEWDNTNYYCANVGGQLPAHLFVKETDVNPNSSTYGQIRWTDVGPSDECPSNLYYNTVQSGVFYKNNCSTGYGSSYTYTVQPGVYNSSVSLAAANQLATNDVNANGQAAANASGTCCAPTFTLGGGLTAQYQNVSMNGSVVHPTFVVQYPGAMSFTLATLTSSCLWPTATRVIPFQHGSSIFNITVSTSGVITVSLVSGPMPTGFVAFQGFYDLYLTTYYSVQKSGQFTRNNCPAGQTGGTVTYTVPQFSYYSTIDQADADQKAQNDVNTNGQTYANNTGTCSVTCTFTQFSGTWFNKVVTHNGSTASFNLVYMCPNNNYSSGSLGTISTGCKPVAQRNVSVSESGRTWNVTITTGGIVTISLQSGTPASQGATIALSGSYVL